MKRLKSASDIFVPTITIHHVVVKNLFMAMQKEKSRDICEGISVWTKAMDRPVWIETFLMSHYYFLPLAVFFKQYLKSQSKSR